MTSADRVETIEVKDDEEGLRLDRWFRIHFPTVTYTYLQKLLRSGQVRVDSKRVESAPDIPTTDEAGLPGFHMTLWSGMWVPKGTPADVIAKLNAAVVDALNDPGVKKQLENLGLQMPPKDKQTPQALGDWQKSEIARWWPIIKAANVKVD